MKQPHVVAITQARLGSTRLPGKALMDIEGKTMLERVVERIQLAKHVDEVVVATTDNKRDDKVAEKAGEIGAGIFRGSEGDVLDRYYQAAKKFNADIVVRVTSDCPLADHKVIDEMVLQFESESPPLDYLSNNIPPSFPHGIDVEVFSFSALEKCWKEAKEPHQREHVTPFIREHPEVFKSKNFSAPENNSGYRFTVDFPEDLEFVREVYKRIGGDVFGYEQVLELLKEHPEISSINEQAKKKWNDPGVV